MEIMVKDSVTITIQYKCPSCGYYYYTALEESKSSMCPACGKIMKRTIQAQPTRIKREERI